MSNLIKNLRIQNFKSIKDLSLDCERINVFIGKPNAGKSNILEAVSLLGAGYSKGKFMNGFIRYSSVIQLFRDFDLDHEIKIVADETESVVRASKSRDEYYFSINPFDEDQSPEAIQKRLDYENYYEKPYYEETFIPYLSLNFGQNGKIENYSKSKRKQRESPVKKYEYKSIGDYHENGFFLHPPNGENFYFIAQSSPKLRAEIQQFLKPNGLDFLLDLESHRMAVVKKTETSLLSFPLHLVPDTFQRYFFHLAAIMSNNDSVLLFEEPESHSYGPYIYQLAQDILNDEGSNQFFLTTHNPYFLLPLMQEGKDVAVFTTWFENYETYAKRLTNEEIREILDYGIDVFLNLDHFIPE